MAQTRRTLQGEIVKISSAQTVKVRIEKKQAHPLYGKVIRSHKQYLVHAAETENLAVGDLVIIGETKPISKRKSWEIVSKLEVKHK